MEISYYEGWKTMWISALSYWCEDHKFKVSARGDYRYRAAEINSLRGVEKSPSNFSDILALENNAGTLRFEKITNGFGPDS